MERWFTDATGRLHWPWRLAVFVLFLGGALITATTILYPVAASLLGAAGVRLIAYPWIALAAAALAHALVKSQADPRLAWADVGLTLEGARPSLVGTQFAAGALAIVLPSLALVLVGWLAFVPAEGAAWGPVLATALGVLLPAALQEELLFRGYAFTVLTERFGAVVAVAVTSVGFSLLHLTNPSVSAQSLLLVALAGAWLGIVRVVTGSLWAAYAAHLGWNVAMVLGLHAPVSGLPFAAPGWTLVDRGPAWVTGGSWGPEGGLAAAVGMLAATAAVMARPSGRALAWRPGVGALFTRPAGRGEA